MKKYESATPDFTRDMFVSRSRNHAFNRAVSALSIAVVGVIVINYAAIKLLHRQFFVESLVLIACVTLLSFGNSLKEYTNQDRDIILSQHFQLDPVEEIVEPAIHESRTVERTEFPHPQHKNGRLFVSIGLTDAQREKVAKIGLEKKSLPINMLESLGLSRQNAEMLRMDLGSHGLGYFTDSDRFVITKDGEKVFSKILARS